MAREDQWADVQRVEGWAGEVRANLIRMAALTAFYGHHLVNAYLLHDDPSLRGVFHFQVTALVIAWALAAGLLHFCLVRRWAPPWLKFASTAVDLCLLTAVLALPGNGPRSPLVVLYFLVIAGATLRLSLALVYATTLGSMAAYLIVLGQYVFLQVGTEAYYAANSPARIPRAHQVIFLLALGVAGLLAGQVVRQVRRITEGLPVMVAEPRKE